MQAQRETVLIVEDEVELGWLTAEALAHHFETVVANDAEKALRIVRTQPVDAIMADIMLPEMDGTEFVVALVNEGAKRKAAPIAVMTGLPKDDLRLKVLRDIDVVKCIIQKPFKFELLGFLIRTLISGNMKDINFVAAHCTIH